MGIKSAKSSRRTAYSFRHLSLIYFMALPKNSGPQMLPAGVEPATRGLEAASSAD